MQLFFVNCSIFNILRYFSSMKHPVGHPVYFHTSRAPKIHNLFFVYREFIEEKFDELLHEPSGEFDNFCRMTLTDFEILLSISPIISKQDTDFREAIPAKFRLIMTLRFLASGDSYRSLHYLFKVSKASISGIIREVSRAFNEVLKDEVKVVIFLRFFIDKKTQITTNYLVKIKISKTKIRHWQQNFWQTKTMTIVHSWFTCFIRSKCFKWIS